MTLPAEESVTIEDIVKARARIQGRVRETPMLPNTLLTERVGASVSLKCENLQRTGSFKLRGALNVIGELEGSAGVIAASAGNHAQAVALAAAEREIPALILMPRDAPIAKQRATLGYGAEVMLVDGPLATCIDEARVMARERGLLFVPPFDLPGIVAGQGTVGLEIVEQAPDVETVIVPAGGGGLLAGIALAVKSRRPQAKVIGVQTKAMPGIVASLTSGAPLKVSAARTMADGVAVAGPSTLTFDLIRRYVDDVVTVSEETIAQAIVFLIERARLVAEGAGAMGVAALMSGAVQSPGRTVAVVSGGNIDVNTLGRLVSRGLLVEGRHRTLTVAAANVAGEMSLISTALASAGANILEVRHELITVDLPVGVARLVFRVEVAGAEAWDALLSALSEGGLQPGTATDFVTPAAAAMPW